MIPSPGTLAIVFALQHIQSMHRCPGREGSARGPDPRGSAGPQRRVAPVAQFRIRFLPPTRGTESSRRPRGRLVFSAGAVRMRRMADRGRGRLHPRTAAPAYHVAMTRSDPIPTVRALLDQASAQLDPADAQLLLAHAL